MLDESPPASRGARPDGIPQRRERKLGTVLATPAVPTPAASPERKRRRNVARRGHDDGWPKKNGAAPVGASGPQYYKNPGQQFTVGNVSNGLIYLRPVIKPTHEPHHSHVFPPSTPPSSVEEAEERRQEAAVASNTSPSYSRPRHTSPPETPTGTRPAIGCHRENMPYMKSSPPVPRTRHHRSRSCTTMDDHLSTVRDSAYGNLQVRVDQYDGPAREGARPRTAGHDNFQSLDVQIPQYTLGSPRFSPNGTPFLYGSSSLRLQSTIGEMGSSQTSQQAPPGWLWPGIDPRTLSPTPVGREMTASISSTMAPQSSHQTISQVIMPPALAPSPIPPPETITSIPLVPSPPVPTDTSPLVIEPGMYDQLSDPPGSDDPLIVRYNSQSREISAAVPARIIAQITSATFVDYHLLSDFFLTYRVFMSPSDLAAHLISRLQWAMNKSDDTGKVVRVRTFVAIRHWLLNYFADDFLPSLIFREEFAKAMNRLTNVVRTGGQASDLKIIGELKKCWRRTCVLYWDSTETEGNPEDDIASGGEPGRRGGAVSRPQSSLLRLPRYSTPPPRLDLGASDSRSGTESFIRDVVQPTIFEKNDGGRIKVRASSPTLKTPSISKTQSNASTWTATATDHKAERQKPSSLPSMSSSPTKTAGSGPHKRSGSFSDALRDNRHPLPLPNSIARSTQLFMALPFAGSLVRGNLFPPTPAFVEVIAPSTPASEITRFNFGTQSTSSGGVTMVGRSMQKHLTVPSSKAAPGVRRLIGSVRKAFGGKAPPSKSGKTSTVYSKSISRNPSIQRRISAIEALSTTASIRMGLSGDGQVARIDLLGAGAVDAFQRVMMEATIRPDQDQFGSSGAMTSGDDTTSEREAEYASIGRIDGAVDSKTDVVVEVGSVKSECTPKEPEAERPCNYPRKAFLHSPSTLGHTQDNVEMLLGGGLSLMTDKSGQSTSFRDSVLEEQQSNRKEVRTPSPRPTYGTRSGGLRRSKSFSFEKAPPLLRKQFRSITDKSSPAGGGNLLWLRSGRFALSRVNSGLSRHSSGMDNVSEFSESSSLTKGTEDQGSPRGLLRRRPGGNLRAAAISGQLEHPRPMSTGSMCTGVLSLEESYADLQMRPRPGALPLDQWPLGALGPPPNPAASGVVSLGAMGRSPGVHHLPTPVVETPRESVDSGRSSEVERDSRASFEAGVQLLRDLPDDDSDDGGIEVALAKLEGTYPRKKSVDISSINFRLSASMSLNRELPSSFSQENDRWTTGLDGTDEVADGGKDQYKRLKRRHKHVMDCVPLPTPPIMDGNLSPQEETDGGRTIFRTISQESVPILERGLSVTMSQRQDPSIDSPGSLQRQEDIVNPDIGVDLNRVALELERHRGAKDDASDLSSEMSFNMQQNRDQGDPKFHVGTPGTIISELGIPSHPLRHSPSPPMNVSQAFLQGHDNSEDHPRTLNTVPMSGSGTIGTSPRSKCTQHTQLSETPRTRRESAILQPVAIHLPFILAYDSELLAKQFTLIEKDALLEVDWRELVELSWSQADSEVRDWVELLNSRDIKGVEVVIARFNLMCRWARSEIVMTKSVDERARTIVKLIHIAAHARRMQNYATTYQLTIALLTADIARLRQTWALVSAAERGTFKELESLVQPVRNFHNLRGEMDKVTGETGCIPFVGLFTHDLILNAQRPPTIQVEGGKGPLVNFERHRTTAAIVKRLLRLIEASHQYTFEAVDGVCERCLWISALDDEEIRGLSRGIEP